jgi:Trm5-related predicted tRNA methylase
MINRIQEVIMCINKKYPLSRVIVSSLLPRKDDLNRRASEINKTIQKIFEKNKTVKIVQHNNIMSTKHLKDKKHLI